MNLWSQVGALSGAAAVALGAFGAHGLQKRANIDANMINTWQTAAHYHLLHSVVLTVSPLLTHNHYWSVRLLAGGMLLFSGSLYSLVLTGEKRLGAVTPVGGLALIGGWYVYVYNTHIYRLTHTRHRDIHGQQQCSQPCDCSSSSLFCSGCVWPLGGDV